MLTVSSANATHLMGGDFSYEYKGKVGSRYQYEITIEMYRDCQQTVPSTPFDTYIEVGIYYNNATKSQYDVVGINLGTESVIDPPSGGSNCSWKPSVCIRKGVYVKTILLPASTTGFHLTHIRCCRNNLNNILQDIGQTYYVFIPPNSYFDNSPTFSGVPTPYICAQDTVNISYAATDADGDSLSYSLVLPYAGGSDNDPIPTPAWTLGLPIPGVTYAASHNVFNPFGVGGVCTINPNTGLVKVMCPQAGLYAIAVEVSSFRNGSLVSIVRRDIELIVLNCPPNQLPQLAISGGITSYAVDEGNAISFDIPYTDSDSMYFKAKGGIFGGVSVPAPYATLSPAQGKDTVSSTFSWNTSCDHGKSTPYFFTVEVEDNGCPYKTAITIFQIFVIPFEGPDSISGPTNVCEYDDSLEYKVHGLSANSLINWTISGGSILSGIGTNTVKVKWGSAGVGTLKIYETSQYGCGPELVSKFVNIHQLPIAEAGNNVFLCSGDTILLGDTNANQNHIYSWHTANNLSDSSSFTPLFSMQNQTGTPIVLTYYLSVITANNCEAFDSIIITVYPQAQLSSISGPLSPCFLGTFPYKVTNTSSSAYYWSVEGGSQVSGLNTNEIEIHWTDTFQGKLDVYEVNQYGCYSDTQTVDVVIVRPDAHIFGPAVVCPNTVHVDYWVKYRSGSNYNWFVSGGTRVDNNGNGPAIEVSWPDSGMAMIKVVETTLEGCISDTDYFPVLISYRLQTSDISGDTFVCAWSKNEAYQVMNVNGSTYDWWIDGGWIVNGNGRALIHSDWGTDGLGMLKVLETSYDSINDKYCYGDTVYQPVVINPYPITTPISGRKDVCELDTVAYHVNGFTGSIYYWTISDSSIAFDGQGNDSIVVYWQTQGDYTLKVVELTVDSCYGDFMDTIVSVHPNPTTSEISGNGFICYPNNKNILYQVTGFAGSTFNWGIIGGYFPSTNGNPQIAVDWTTVNVGTLSVQETTEWGCIGSVITKNIQADSLAPIMELVTTRPLNDLDIQVFWDMKNDFHFTKKVALFKNSVKQNNWTFVDSFSSVQRDFVDQIVKTHDLSYQYKVAVENLCGETFYSYPHNSILLLGEKISDFDLKLNWTSYVNWPEDVERYNIYRRVNSESMYKLVESTSDTSIILEAGLNGIHQCFRIAAVRRGKETIMSWSNEACFEFEPVLHVPNAFSPNSDGVNDSFTVISANIAVFEMSIFNRWGEMVFQTFDRYDGWDGMFKGKPAPIDVYVVVIKYQGNTPEMTYTGNITIIK